MAWNYNVNSTQFRGPKANQESVSSPLLFDSHIRGIFYSTHHSFASPTHMRDVNFPLLPLMSSPQMQFRAAGF